MKAKTRKYFNRIKKVMNEDGIYLPIYDSIIEHAAEVLALIEDAKKELDTHGQTQHYETGARAASPELNNYRGLLADYAKYADKLGLTPIARDKLRTQKVKQKAKSRLMGIKRGSSKMG